MWVETFDKLLKTDFNIQSTVFWKINIYKLKRKVFIITEGFEETSNLIKRSESGNSRAGEGLWNRRISANE